MSDRDSELRRVLGPFDTTMIVMGCIVGAGIFKTPMNVAAGGVSLAGILGLWAAGGAIALCGALVFAELAAMMPRAGGQYVFIREGFGRFVAFLYGWLLIAAINSSAIAYIAHVFVDHAVAVLSPFLAADPGPTVRRALCIFLVGALTLLNVRGLRLGATIQNVAMVAKIGGILVVCLLGLAVLGGAPVDAPAAEPLSPDGPAWGGLGAAVMAVVFSYGGWQNVAAVSAEVRRPERNLPRGILLGTLAVITLYMAMNWSMVVVLGPAGVAASETPAATAAGAVLPHGELLVSILVMVSTVAICQAYLMVTPRIYYAMALDGVFFRSAARVHPRYGTPAVAIGLQGMFCVAHLLVGDALNLLQVTVLVDWIFFSLCAVALFLFRARLPDLPRPYRAWGYPWLPAVFLVFALAIVVSSVLSAERVAVLRALGIFVAGVALYVLWSRRARAPEDGDQGLSS